MNKDKTVGAVPTQKDVDDSWADRDGGVVEEKPAAVQTQPSPSRALTPIEDVRGTLSRMEPQFRSALPGHISPDKFMRVAVTAIQTMPDLLNADRHSLYGACMRAAQDGLLPDGREAALVIFAGRVAYMPMMSGILKKVRNSGELSSIAAQIVHKADKFRFWVDGDGEHLEHEPFVFGERGDIIGAYALAKTKDGAVYIEVMTLAQIEQVRSISRAKDSGPWKTWWGEMARKTVIRRLSKRLPMSTDLEHVIHADDELTDFEKRTTGDDAPVQQSRLGKIVEAASPL